MESRYLRYQVTIAITVLVLVILSSSLLPVKGQEPGVTVINVPPEFSSLDIRSKNGLHNIEVVISDYNSWGDIFTVEVEVLDEREDQIARVVFQQYADNTTAERTDAFLELLGEILIRDLSTVSYNLNPQTIDERTEMHILFVISPVSGRWLTVTATDLSGLFAIARVEYLTGLIGGAAVIPPLVLIMLALGASVVIVGARLRRERFGG